MLLCTYCPAVRCAANCWLPCIRPARRASLEHEEHHYHDAVSTWGNLLAVVPANSSDARIIEANIAEASRLAAGQG